ncbi:DUF2169 family type VI secretion system accessory protein [Mesoterricola silvestris]|uniref:DUF2169 domain-containing protein n=1 Tax=Mesoterricola silvestris TaxID=2927979 RepID=A0AA48KAW9_9BACT|nr:DUF2169 domain-containing protein [Mesoterricola silvestris]BDU73732.1 hypothetical protein METEAL_29060 [Mesoterricola silvestris]
MKTIRPMQVSVCSRVLEQGHRFYSIHSASMGLRIPSGEPLLDLDFLKEALGALGPDDLPDAGMPKPQGEVLLTGAFHSPGGRPVAGHEVLFRVGPVERRLFVFGPRRWGALGPTEPGPVAHCPLDPAHAFGGAGFQANPAGQGWEDGQLPQVEDPAHLVASPRDRPDPAFPGPAGPGHPRRRAFQPDCGPDYLHRDFPGYPAGFDWRFFLCGPGEQRLPGYFRGDESYAFHHLHPEIEVLQGRLPGFRVRCFLNQDLGGAPQFSELSMNLDTVWCFPAQSLLWLFWRGGREVADDEASRITHLLAAFESPGAPRGLDHYREALARRLEAQDPLLDVLATQDLIPPDQACALERLTAPAQPAPSAFSRNMEAQKDRLRALAREKLDAALAQAREALPAQGPPEPLRLDGEALRPPSGVPAPDPGARALQEEMERLLPGVGRGGPVQLKDFSFGKLDRVLKAVETLTRSRKDELTAHVDATRAGALAGMGAQAPADLPGELRRALDTAARTLEDGAAPGPARVPLPRFDPRPLLEPLEAAEAQARAGLGDMAARGSADGAAALGATVDGLEPVRSRIQESLRRAEAAFRPLYLRGAHRMPEGASPHAEDLPTRRAAFLRALAGGGPLAGGDWACLDLAGLKLDGVDLSGAYLEQVDLRGASLRGANLRGAILARARLEAADFTGADLEGANLGGAAAARARFPQANLLGATLELGTFAGADFQGCRLGGATLMEVDLDRADFAGAFLESATFLRLEVQGARFWEARLGRATFLQCAWREADFSGARLDHTTWADPRLEEVRFDGADLEAACFLASAPGKAVLAGLSFAGARLDRGTFLHLPLRGARFREASLAGALFSGADLAGADLSGARARQAQFRKAILTGANLERIDLMEGSLAKANLVQARFRGANLHGVDVLRSTLGATDFTDCNLERTLLQGWRPR